MSHEGTGGKRHRGSTVSVPVGAGVEACYRPSSVPAGAGVEACYRPSSVPAGTGVEDRHGSSSAPAMSDDRRGRFSVGPQQAGQSEPATGGLTVLRGARGSVHLAVADAGKQVQLELRSGRHVLLSGDWHVSVRRDGHLLPPVCGWRKTLRHSDAKGDYFELELQLADQVRLQRHIFLPGDDRFAFLADAVIGDRPAAVAYQAQWQLSEQVQFEPAADNWEAYLRSGKRRAAVLPLALPEWRCQSQRGQLLAAGRSLVLRQTRCGRCLLAPLFLDFKRRRFRRGLTWRQLTVAQSLSPQTEDVAVAYRVAVGNRQWLIYRALAYCASRTVLGHHLVSEFLLARFFRSGKVKPLVEIAPSNGQ